MPPPQPHPHSASTTNAGETIFHLAPQKLRRGGVGGKDPSPLPRRRSVVVLRYLAAAVASVALVSIFFGHRYIVLLAGTRSQGEAGRGEALRAGLEKFVDEDDDGRGGNDGRSMGGGGARGRRSPVDLPSRRSRQKEPSMAAAAISRLRNQQKPGVDASLGSADDAHGLQHPNVSVEFQSEKHGTVLREGKTDEESEKKSAGAAMDAEKDVISDGTTVTEMLLNRMPFPGGTGGDDGGLQRQRRVKYRPGTLHMTSAEALQRCYINRTVYGGHLDRAPINATKKQPQTVLVSMSEEHALLYRNIPKSASSTARWVVENHFGGGDRRLKIPLLAKLVREDGYTFISFVRDPLSRFYSSYEEAFFRMGPWMGTGKIVKNKPRVRGMYFQNKYKVDPYPYLYEGLDTIEDYRLLFCGRRKNIQCDSYDTIDDGNLASRLELFVRDYDGRRPFDVHLKLQTAFLVESSGRPLPVQILYNASEAGSGWDDVARRKNFTLPLAKHARHAPRRVNMALISDEAKRRICRLSALDYCCLNLPLPPVCAREDVAGVFCAAERHGSDDARIQPWSDLEYFREKDVHALPL